MQLRDAWWSTWSEWTEQRTSLDYTLKGIIIMSTEKNSSNRKWWMNTEFDWRERERGRKREENEKRNQIIIIIMMEELHLIIQPHTHKEYAFRQETLPFLPLLPSCSLPLSRTHTHTHCSARSNVMCRPFSIGVDGSESVHFTLCVAPDFCEGDKLTRRANYEMWFFSGLLIQF